MAISHAASGQVVEVRPLDKSIATAITHTIVKTNDLEVIRVVLLAGNELPPHEVPGDITVQCLEGKVEFGVGDLVRELTRASFCTWRVAANIRYALRKIHLCSSLLC